MDVCLNVAVMGGCSRGGLLGFVHEERWEWVGQDGVRTWESLGGSILQSCVPGRGGGDWIKAERIGGTGWRIGLRVCLWRGLSAEVGIQEVCRWWKAGHGVNGIESQACVALDSLYVVVVNCDKTLDGRWKCVSQRLMSDRGVSKCVETVQVLVENESVDVEVSEDAHEGMWWLEGVYFGPKRLVCRDVGGG